ncbi:MAG: hypothetical protein M3R00_02335 [Pseudomonadota bacterium]|nr:hypothetical protein [Pseudomonadota bacterium]
MTVSKHEALSLQLKGIGRPLNSAEDERINHLLSMIEVFGECVAEVLTQWCAQEFVAGNNTRTAIGVILEDHLGQLEPKPALYYAVLVVKQLEPTVDSEPHAKKMYREISAAIQKFADWPNMENKLGANLKLIIDNNKEWFQPDFEYHPPRKEESNEDILISLAEQFDSLEREPDSESDERITGLILALSQIRREHVTEDLGRLCAIEFVAGNNQQSNIIKIFVKKLERLTPKSAIYYALKLLTDLETSRTATAIEARNSIIAAITQFAAWPFDEDKLADKVGKTLKDILSTNEVASLLDAEDAIEPAHAAFKIIQEIAGDKVLKTDRKEALERLHHYFPAYKPPLSERFPPPSARSQEKRVNEYITKKMRALLEELGSEYVKIDWKIDLSTSEAKMAFKEIVQSHRNIRLMSEMIDALSEKGIAIRSSKINDEATEHIQTRLMGQMTCVKVDGSLQITSVAKLNHTEAIVNAQRIELIQSSPESLPSLPHPAAEPNVWEDRVLTSHNVGRVRDLLTHTLAELPIDLPEGFAVANELSAQGVGILQQVFAGALLLAKIQENTLNAEDISHYFVNLGDSAFDLAKQFAPQAFNAAFKQTPFGPMFVAGRQITNEIFFAKAWHEGRAKHHELQFSIGERCEYFANLYQATYVFLIGRIREHITQLKALTGITDDKAIRELIDGKNTHDAAIEKIIHEINELSHSITVAKSSVEHLINETRKEASRVNVDQQVLMTGKHIERLLNAVMLGLGVGAIFVPILSIPAAITGLTKNIAEVVVKKQAKKAVNLVQGIYEVDNLISANKATAAQAIKKMRTVKEILFQYSPPVIDAFRLLRSYENTVKQIREHPEYTLNIPDAFAYRELDSYANPRDIIKQIEAFTLTCDQLEYHFRIIANTDAFDYVPEIRNIDALKKLVDDWSENLRRRMRDQEQSPDSRFLNKYFTEEKQREIANAHTNMQRFFDLYAAKQKAAREDDDTTLTKIYTSMVDEIETLNKILDHLEPGQEIINYDKTIANLQHRLELYQNRYKGYPTTHDNAFKFLTWQYTLETRLYALQDRHPVKAHVPPEPHVTAKHLKHAFSSENIRINEIDINLGPGIKHSARSHITVPIHHYRRFESRKAANELFSHHLASKARNQYTELYLTPVDKITKNLLYKAGFWKNLWIIRGINRALEFVTHVINRVNLISPNILPVNLEKVLSDYHNQLKLMRDNDQSHLSNFGRKIVQTQIDKAIAKITQLQSTIKLQIVETNSKS